MNVKMEDVRVGNGAGTLKTLADADEYLASALTDITVGSISWDPKSGNAGDNFNANKHGTSFNCLGLPNPGMSYWEEHASDFTRKAKDRDKRTRISLVADDPRTFANLTYRALESGWDEVEINGSCPHRFLGGKQAPVLCYNPESLEMTVDQIWLRTMPQTFDFKLAPFWDSADLDEALHFLLGHRGVSGIVLCNSGPNTYDMKWGDGTYRPLVDANNGFAGMSGIGLLPISLSHVQRASVLRAKMKVKKKIIGVGGIHDGDSFLKYTYCGANAGQMVTHLLNRDVRKSVGQVVRDFGEDLAREMLNRGN